MAKIPREKLVRARKSPLLTIDFKMYSYLGAQLTCQRESIEQVLNWPGERGCASLHRSKRTLTRRPSFAERGGGVKAISQVGLSASLLQRTGTVASVS